MKKIFLIIISLFIGSCYAMNCEEYCSEPYDLSHGVSRFMSTVTGSNAAAKKIAQVILRKSIVKQAQGDFKVKVDSYSVKDLKKGIFKSFNLKGKNVDIGGVSFSELRINTLCKFNYIAMDNDKKPIFKEAFPVVFSVIMSEDDINKTMDSKSYRNIIDNINIFGRGYVKVSSGQVRISDNRFYYVLNVSVPFVRNLQELIIYSDLKVKNGDIDFTNTKLVSNLFLLDLKKVDWLINYLNPLDYSLEVLENNNANLTVQNVRIKDDKVYADGYVVIPKSKG